MTVLVLVRLERRKVERRLVVIRQVFLHRLSNQILRGDSEHVLLKSRWLLWVEGIRHHEFVVWIYQFLVLSTSLQRLELFVERDVGCTASFLVNQYVL